MALVFLLYNTDNQYIILNKEGVDENTLKYSSPNTDSYIIEKKNKCHYKLYYKSNSGVREFKLKKERYSDEIDRIRFNIFRAYDYSKNGNWQDVELLKEQFLKFKKSPLKYLNNENDTYQFTGNEISFNQQSETIIEEGESNVISIGEDATILYQKIITLTEAELFIERKLNNGQDYFSNWHLTKQ